MTPEARQVQRVYLLLTLLTTLATSFIWGINTLFLLDAGLSNEEAFAANAFFSLGQVVFEVPTGVVADTRGRRLSFLLGAATLLVATLLYLAMWQVQAPLAGWAAASMLLGLGFTFFSGAMEAWLVDALGATGFRGSLESVLGRGQAVAGAAMLTGSVLGGVVAQVTNLGVPFLLRALVLGIALLAAFFLMHDLGFRPRTGVSAVTAVREVARGAVDGGLRNRPVRWMMLAAPFSVGVGFYVFYALQPYLLELYGDPGAYSVAGVAAAIVAAGQIVGGLAAARVGRRFARRTEAVATLIGLEVVVLLVLGLAGLAGIGVMGVGNMAFAAALLLVAAWALVSAIATPIRQAYLNGVIPSSQRATVLSFGSLMGSAGGVVIQPALGRVADVSGYAASFVVAAVVDALALPFVLLARRERAPSDPTGAGAGGAGSVAG